MKMVEIIGEKGAEKIGDALKVNSSSLQNIDLI
jgi:hypothetical protein